MMRKFVTFLVTAAIGFFFAGCQTGGYTDIQREDPGKDVLLDMSYNPTDIHTVVMKMVNSLLVHPVVTRASKPPVITVSYTHLTLPTKA